MVLDCTFENIPSVLNQGQIAALPNSSYDLGPYIYPSSLEKDVMCGWKQLTEEDDFDWTRQSGSTPSANTGPRGDHTHGNGMLIVTKNCYY